MVQATRRCLSALALVWGSLLFAEAALAQGGFAGGAGDESGGFNATGAMQNVGAKQIAAPPPPVPVNVLAVPFPISGAIDDQVALLIEAGGKALLTDVQTAQVAGDVHVSATDASGKVVDELTQEFVLDTSDEVLQHGGLKLYAVLRVPPGDYEVKARVRNLATRGHGEREVTVHAPDFARKEAALSPPLLPDLPNRWRVFRQSESPHDELPFPFVDKQGGGFLPAAAPTLGPGGGELVVYAYGRLTDAQNVEARLLGADGKAVPARATVLDSAQGRFVIQRRLLLRIEGPLEEGSYGLEVTLSDSAGAQSTRTAVAVVADAPQAEALARSAPAEEEPQAPVEEAPALPEGWTQQQLAERYRTVLARAASGDLDGAARDLAELEPAATPKRSGGQLKALRAVERSALETTTRSAQGLLPLVYLYTKADAELLSHGQAWMAAQNRLFAAELVARWVKANASDPAAPHVAAQLLAFVGSSAEALEYEPTNELALLRLAISAEKGGLLAEAAQSLQTLIKAHPESAHARLRLAIVLKRQGQTAEAERMLGGVMNDAGAAPWVAALACQQLAELAHDQGQAERAETLLEQGIERIGQQSLFLQLAYYLDERQRSDEAVGVLNGMPVNAGPQERSGRHLYNAPPEAELALARQQVEARVAAEWPQLGAALGVPVTPQRGST